jgi:microcystin-dependent protein
MSNITNKNQATSYLNANITNDVGTEPFLNPTPTYAIKSGNLKYYLNRFIEWIFPGTPTDVRGKVLGIPHSNTPNTDYSGLSWLTMMPLGGITMYAVNGINKDMGGGVYKAMINTTNPTNNNQVNYTTELDGFLFCQSGASIDVTVVGNEKYAPLQKLLVGYYGNVTGNMLILPALEGRVPLGGRFSSSSTDSFIVDASNMKDIQNYGKTGNIGGEQSHDLEISEMPTHSHDSGTLVTQTIRGGNGLGVNGSDLTLNNEGQYYNLDIQGDTGNKGGGNTHENRQPYMVLSYIIKY